jgi:hypothetical protein
VTDRVAALVFLPPRPVHHLFVEGRAVVRSGAVTTAVVAR